MIKNATNSEYLLIQKTAQEYRRKGFEVSIEPLLDFFPGFRADLVVQKGEESKVIEVKTRSSLAAEPKISELARQIESKPGWSFELLLVSEPEKLDSPEDAQSFEGESILLRIEESEKSLEAGFPEAAFLLAWSACEASIRELLVAQGVLNSSITRPGYILDQAVYTGVISRNDYNILTDLQKYRNAIVHGFTAGGFCDALVRDLIGIVRRIATAGTHRDNDINQSSQPR